MKIKLNPLKPLFFKKKTSNETNKHKPAQIGQDFQERPVAASEPP